MRRALWAGAWFVIGYKITANTTAGRARRAIVREFVASMDSDLRHSGWWVA